MSRHRPAHRSLLGAPGHRHAVRAERPRGDETARSRPDSGDPPRAPRLVERISRTRTDRPPGRPHPSRGGQRPGAAELADESFLRTRVPKSLATPYAPERTVVRSFTSSHDRRL